MTDVISLNAIHYKRIDYSLSIQTRLRQYQADNERYVAPIHTGGFCAKLRKGTYGRQIPISVKNGKFVGHIFYLGTSIDSNTNTNDNNILKKGFLILAALFMISSASYAQKFCYVDMEYILSKLSSYGDAQKELNKVSDGYQKEIEAKRKAVDDMFKQYQSEQVLMTDQMKQQKMKEIEAAEKEVKDLQKKRFGPDGDLFAKRKELIKPIQDKVYDEITKYAQAKSYEFIFDKSSGPSLLYATEKLNKSDDILFNMGVQKK